MHSFGALNVINFCSALPLFCRVSAVFLPLAVVSPILPHSTLRVASAAPVSRRLSAAVLPFDHFSLFLLSSGAPNALRCTTRLINRPVIGPIAR